MLYRRQNPGHKPGSRHNVLSPMWNWKSNIVNIGCELLNMRGHFTFGRINSLCSYDKSLLYWLLCRARHHHPLLLLSYIYFPYPLSAKIICSSVLPSLLTPPCSEIAYKVHHFYDATEFAQNYYIIQVAPERCLAFKSEVMALANHCCPGSLLLWEQQNSN